MLNSRNDKRKRLRQRIRFINAPGIGMIWL
jgi:hypothetical protein